MKTTSKTTCVLLIAAFLFSSCGQSTGNPTAELATLPVYELSPSQSVKAVRKTPASAPSVGKRDGRITAFLTDCESQLDRIRDGFSASIGQPHR